MATSTARAGLSKRSAGVRRLLQEASELSADDSPDYTAAPLEEDLFDWHFTIRGLSGSQFDGGVYHGRMILPSDYPFKPPEIYLLTPSGRFEINKKICLSISSFHPETWQPSWGVRTALLALISFFESDPKGAAGSLDTPADERKRLANASHQFKCSTCGYDASNHDSFAALPEPALSPPPAQSASEKTSNEDEQETEEVVEPESMETSATNSTTSTPPPEPQIVEAVASKPPTTIFPAASSAPRPYPQPSPPTDLSPVPTEHSSGPSSSGAARHHHHPSHQVRYRTNAEPSTSTGSPTGVPRLPHAHLTPPSPTRTQPLNPAPPASSPQVVAPSHARGAATLARTDAPMELEGGPPTLIDRAILIVVLLIVALIVQKFA